MKIIFKTWAYQAVGYALSYTGKFIKTGENKFTEDDNGELMTLNFERGFVTVGKELYSKDGFAHIN